MKVRHWGTLRWFLIPSDWGRRDFFRRNVLLTKCDPLLCSLKLECWPFRGVWRGDQKAPPKNHPFRILSTSRLRGKDLSHHHNSRTSYLVLFWFKILVKCQLFHRILLVGDLSINCDEERIYCLFSAYGEIDTIELKESDRDPQRVHLGFGFIKFTTTQAAKELYMHWMDISSSDDPYEWVGPKIMTAVPIDVWKDPTANPVSLIFVLQIRRRIARQLRFMWLSLRVRWMRESRS